MITGDANCPEHSDPDAQTACFVHELRLLCDANGVLDAVVRQTDHAVMVVDLDGIVLLWNPASERLSGWSASEALGSEISEVLAASTEAALGPLRSLAASATPVERYVRVRRTDGSMVRVRVTLVPLEDREGHVCGLLGVASSVARDERFDRLRRDFIDMAASELRSPLTSVLGYAQLLSTSHVLEDPEERRRIMRSLEDRCTDLSALIDDLVLASGLSDGESDEDREVLDAFEVADSVVRRANADLSGYGVTLRPDSQRVRVEADRLSLEHALEGLVGAALDDARSGCVDVRVSRSATQAVLEVGPASDSGPTPMVAADRTGPASESSLASGHRHSPSLLAGIRLRVAEHFANLHYGDVSDSYDVESGSTFVLRLPLAPAEGN